MTFGRLLWVMMVTSLLFLVALLFHGVVQIFALAGSVAGLFIIYFSPALIAESLGHPSRMAIFILNLFLGWTALGWIAALVWAHTGSEATPPDDEMEDEEYVQCPFCAEDIRAEAILCRHCGSMLQSPRVEPAVGAGSATYAS